MSGEYKVLGQTPSRTDGVDKVTGAAHFGADIQLPGLQYGKVLRSPHPHARITRLDVSKAAAYPGVRAVVTAADFPRVAGGAREMGETSVDTLFLQDMVMARETVKWQGHPVAAVAAVSVLVAEEALALIEVEYEKLPEITDVLAAMEPGAPIIHEGIRTRHVPSKEMGETPSNVAMHLVRERGDLAAGFAQAEHIVERTFRLAMVHQGYIEPQTSTAQEHADGKVTIWTTTQGAFSTRDAVCDLLKLNPGKVKVVPMEVGGAFGGKFYPYLEPLALLLSRKSGLPVKLTMSRAEVLQGTGPTPGGVIRMKMGVGADGKLTAASAWLTYEAGAYPGSAVGAGCLTGLSPYRIPNLRIDGFDVVVNRPRVAAYRAPGATQAAYAVEQMIDELAGQIGMDPIDFRLLNASREGDPRTDGNKFSRIGLTEMLEAARAHPAWTDPQPAGPYSGRGVAIGYWMNGAGTSACQLTLNSDGSINLVTGSVDLTGTRTSMAQVVAEELGMTTANVNSTVGDTESVAYTDGTGGSRTTFATGVAVRNGALALREELKKRAAKLLEASAEDLEFTDGKFQIKGAPARSLTVAEIAAKQGQTGGPIAVSGLATGLTAAPGFSLHIADVTVDPETGKVTIDRYTAFQDVGKAIHPIYVEGQMQGGTAQGIGWALNEEYAWDGGIMRNPTFLDYKMPISLDLPDIECVMIEVAAPEHPYGVRGVGEAPIVPPPATLANAICRATGRRLTQLPMNPERLWRALAQPEGAGKR